MKTSLLALPLISIATLSLGIAYAKPVTYTPGVFASVGTSTDGADLIIGYSFGKNDSNSISIGTGYSKSDFGLSYPTCLHQQPSCYPRGWC